MFQGKLWKICEVLIVKRYILSESGSGLSDVIRAGLSIGGDTGNWKFCEGLAASIAGSKTNDLEKFFQTIGFQV